MSDETTALDLLKEQLERTAASIKKPAHLKMAQALAEGKSQGESYRASGGKGKNPYRCGCELIRTNPNIQAYADLASKIATLESQAALVATKGQKRRMLWSIANKCFEERDEKWVGRGEEAEFVGYTFDSQGAIKAIAELNKMDGDLAVVKTENKHTHQWESMTDEQLEAEIAKRQQLQSGKN